MSQKKILERYCKDHGYTAIRHYDEDDGYSGTNFNRPGFQRMLADIKAGKIKRVIVKDMSRFGRDYLQVGMYTDVLFPEFGVHFIAVNDGVDSTRGENEFTAIRNVFNEMYARDTSKKIRATWQSKGKSGEHLTTIPPYGYIKDQEDKKKWIVDEEAAAVVQKIFSLCVDGFGPTQIAKWLKQHQILNPTANAFEYHADDLLHQLVLCGLYPQRTLFVAVLLCDVGTSCRIRLVAVVFERGNDFVDTLRTHAVDGLSVHSLGHISLPCADIVIGKVVELRVIQISVQSLKTVRFVL